MKSPLQTLLFLIHHDNIISSFIFRYLIFYGPLPAGNYSLICKRLREKFDIPFRERALHSKVKSAIAKFVDANIIIEEGGVYKLNLSDPLLNLIFLVEEYLQNFAREI